MVTDTEYENENMKGLLPVMTRALMFKTVKQNNTRHTGDLRPSHSWKKHFTVEVMASQCCFFFGL